jgi:hypothetical protein
MVSGIAMRTQALLVVVMVLGAILSLLLPILPSTETIQVPYTVENSRVDHTWSYRTEVVMRGTTLQTETPNEIQFKHEYDATARYYEDSKRVVSVSVHGRIRNLSQNTTARNVEVRFFLSETMIYMNWSRTEKFSYVVGTLKPNQEKAYTATVAPRSTWLYPMIYLGVSDIAYDPEPRSQTTTITTRTVLTRITSELFETTNTRTETGWKAETRTSYASPIVRLGVGTPFAFVIGILVIGILTAYVLGMRTRRPVRDETKIY